MVNYNSAPNGWGDTWKRYVEFGILPGSFGESLLCNSLRDAVMRADHINIDLIPRHILWMWDNLPYESWGSPEAVENWNKIGGFQGRKKRANDN